MKEIISLHIGQAGIQLGNSCWELFCLQHGINPQGNIDHPPGNDALNIFYNQISPGRYVTRSVFADLEPTAIDQVRVGPYRRLFNPQQLVAGKQDAGSNFARGYHSAGISMVDIVLDRIRMLAQQCHDLEGFMIYGSLGGGTGSGFSSLLREKLADNYGKKIKFGVNICPTKQLSTSVLQPYNSVMATRRLLQHEDISLVLDNSALSSICRNSLDIEMPTYSNLNGVVAQCISALTTSMRFDGALNPTLSELSHHLVPYPKTHFLMASYSPFLNEERVYLDQISIPQMSHYLFNPANQLARVDTCEGKFMAVSICYRGENIIPKNVSRACCELKTNRTIDFVDWCPTGFRMGINYLTPIPSPAINMAHLTKDCFMVYNATSVYQIFSRINHQFDQMYSKRAFVHWYMREGAELDELTQARQNLQVLGKDYEQVSMDTGEQDVQDY